MLGTIPFVKFGRTSRPLISRQARDLDHRPDLHSPFARHGNPRGDAERLVEIFCLDQESSRPVVPGSRRMDHRSRAVCRCAPGRWSPSRLAASGLAARYWPLARICLCELQSIPRNIPDARSRSALARQYKSATYISRQCLRVLRGNKTHGIQNFGRNCVSSIVALMLVGALY